MKRISGKRGRISLREFTRRAAAAARVVIFDPSKKTANRPAAKSGSARPSSKIIYQEELERLIYRRRQVREAKKELREMRDYIETMLRSGASVQDGVHTAKLAPALTKDGKSRLKVVVL